jgi:hypothetical protein
VRIQPAERAQAQALGNRAALRLVGGKVEPGAVANLVEPEMMGEAVGHSSFPSAMAARSTAARLDQKRPSALTECSSASAPPPD